MARGVPGADFDEFVRSRSARLLRAALAMTGDRQAAEDLVQDVMAKVYVRWATIRTSPDAYARKVLAHAVTDRWRWRGRRAETPLRPVHDRPAPDSSDSQALRDELVRALRTLPPRQRAVVALRYLEDLSEADIATAVGCSVGTVKSQLSRGLVRLRAVVDPGNRDGAAG
ncbi:MAG TPA: SigE family RNA polymerase sigma factor, partial [Mycobacteriales bacterium]|nr:SigE family RNA polymerase sigma factor [Mycobacteriales bacterium]